MAGGNTRNGNSATVIALQQRGPTAVDMMGRERVYITVGTGKTVTFSIHKKPLLEVAPCVEELLGNIQNPTDQIHFPEENEGMFGLFYNYIYSSLHAETREVPAVEFTMNDMDRASRIVNLCKLYLFSEKLYMSNEFSNKVMDKIQDGFLMCEKLPEMGLIAGICQSSPESSPLRAFCAHALLFGLRSGNTTNENALDTLTQDLQKNQELLISFLTAVQKFIPGHDPRVRDCRGDAFCMECYSRGGVGVGVPGYWPCAFHTHDVVPQVDEAGREFVEDQGCYHWRS